MSPKHLAVLLGFLVPGLSLAPRPVVAAWPVNGSALCTAATDQVSPTIVADGAGGAIITWYDFRNGASNNDIFAQHVLASGAVDPGWPANGRALCTDPNFQFFPTIAADGAGGAIVIWNDSRGGASNDIYAQHVLASGAVDPAWPVAGLAVCTAANSQGGPKIVADGAGGAIVTWGDDRSGVSHIYAQRVLASGAVDPGWPADGRALCTAADGQGGPSIIADGAGGAIVTWEDGRGSGDIYVQHVLSSGAVDPAWPVDGRALCTATSIQSQPTIVADGGGGAIVTWADYRGAIFAPSNIYAQHVLASGAVDPAWPANGRAVCAAANDQTWPTIVADGAGGAIVTWNDGRSGSGDIYAQRVLASGAVDPAWPVDGRALCTAANNQDGPSIVADGSGGAVVSWNDFRSGNYDIYAQHVLASGAVDPALPANGRALCTAAGPQLGSPIVADGAGGAIVTWQDYRGGSNYDIYAQHVTTADEVQPTVNVLFPDGGEIIPAGSNQNVTWTASDNVGVTSIDVDYSLDDGLAWNPVAAGVPNSGSYPWSVPNVSTNLAVMRVTAHDAAGNSRENVSHSDFTIADLTAPTVAIVSPNGGESWPPGSTESVTWTAGDNVGVNSVNLEYSVHGTAGPWVVLRHGLTNTGSYNWTVPRSSSSDSLLVRAIAFDAAQNQTADMSDNLFQVPVTTTDVRVGQGLGFALAQPDPNPSAGRVAFHFSLAAAAATQIDVLDVTGRRVWGTQQNWLDAGRHDITWDGRDDHGSTALSGLYFVRLTSGGKSLASRIVRLR